MAGPDPQLGGHVREQPGFRGDRCPARCASVLGVDRIANDRVAELAVARPPDLAAEHLGHQLHAVTDAEHRHVEVEDRRVALRRAGIRHAARSAGENQPDRAFRAERVERRVERHDLGVHRQLAQTTRDELRVLRAEIENENRLM